MRKFLFLLVLGFLSLPAFSQDATALVESVKTKLNKINDYIAEGKMKTDVAFIKAPVGKIKVYYKKPNKFKIVRDGGISILPKGGVSINMNSLLSNEEFIALNSGETTYNGTKVKMVKLLPVAENSDVVLTTLYIDEADLLILKASSTTRENGTFDMEMTYGKYAAQGLPDKVIMAFNTKDYKLPKGITLEFETGEEKDKMKSKKGRVELTYSSYIINKGIADNIFSK